MVLLKPAPKNSTRNLAMEPKMNLQLSSRISGAAISAVLVMSANMVAQQPEHSKAVDVPRYTLRDLGTLSGGTFSQAGAIANWGLVGGVSTVSDGSQHAALWFKGLKLDIGVPGLGGPNSGVFGVNDWAQAVGQAETKASDPNNENFCSYGTGLKCKPFLWQFGTMTRLPLLGGNNGTAGDNVNNRGDIPGISEIGKRDPTCPPGIAINGSGPQVLDYEAVVWDGRLKKPHELKPLPGDSVGEAFWINDNGVAVGTTGDCSNTQLPPFAAGAHAVLWDKYGSPHDLGSFGGTANPAVRGIGNIAFAVNNRNHVVGASVRPGKSNDEAFLWTKETGMVDLGRLDGDTNSAGLGINDKDEVVGGSVNGDLLTGDPHPFLWKKGVMTPLSTLVSPDTELIPLLANGINDVGEITGFGFDPISQEIHAFLATPCGHGDTDAKWCEQEGNVPYLQRDNKDGAPKIQLPDSARKLLRDRLGSANN
jgi:probable HAF family extracellular repeat protein